MVQLGWQDPAGLSAPLEGSCNTAPSPGTASAVLAEGAHPFPWPCPPHLPTPTLLCPLEKPAQASCGSSNRPILMHVTPPSPGQGLAPSLATVSGHQL